MAYKHIEERRKYHREYMKQYRAELKKYKLCINCKSHDAWTMGGHILCYECTIKRLGHEPLRREKKEKPYTIPRNEWFENGWCYKCKSPVMKGEKRWSSGEIRLCEKCYNQILKLARTKPKKILKPVWNTKKAWDNYWKLKAESESRNLEKSLLRHI